MPETSEGQLDPLTLETYSTLAGTLAQNHIFLICASIFQLEFLLAEDYHTTYHLASILHLTYLFPKPFSYSVLPPSSDNKSYMACTWVFGFVDTIWYLSIHLSMHVFSQQTLTPLFVPSTKDTRKS